MPTRPNIGSERLIAFTDGVVAVIITIMVLELKPPHGAGLAGLMQLAPIFLSFVYVAVYWNNHHHFFRLVPHVGGAVMWANLNLLFWFSLIPFATAWMDEHGGAPVPIAVYGATLLLCAASWQIMQMVIVRMQGPDSPPGRHRLGLPGAAPHRPLLCRRSRMVADPGPQDRGGAFLRLKAQEPNDDKPVSPTPRRGRRAKSVASRDEDDP